MARGRRALAKEPPLLHHDVRGRWFCFGGRCGGVHRSVLQSGHGLDFVHLLGHSAIDLAQQRGEDLALLIDRHNRDFARSYQRWFEAVFQDKYQYMGEYDLMRLAFLLDLGFYYLGVAAQPFKRGAKALKEPVFSTTPSTPFFHFIRAYNRRFAQIARRRRLSNEMGRRNHCRRHLIPGYTFAPSSSMQIVKAIAGWVALELIEGWRSWFAPRLAEQPVVRQSPVGAATQTTP